MAESKAKTVRFERGTFNVARPEVLPFLVDASTCLWGIHATFHGLEADLVGAGLATADMFQNLGKSGQRYYPDAYGNRTMVKRRRGNTWHLEIWASSEPHYGDPAEASTRKGKWWREHGAALESETASILARFAKPVQGPRL